MRLCKHGKRTLLLIVSNNHTNFNFVHLCSTILWSVRTSLFMQFTVNSYTYMYCYYAVKIIVIYTLLEINDIPVGQPTKIQPYPSETASKLERGLGNLGGFVGGSNTRILLICLKLKS